MQNVNSYQSLLKGWINRFNVVATKYLDHYLKGVQFLSKLCVVTTIKQLVKLFLKGENILL